MQIQTMILLSTNRKINLKRSFGEVSDRILPIISIQHSVISWQSVKQMDMIKHDSSYHQRCS